VSSLQAASRVRRHHRKSIAAIDVGLRERQYVQHTLSMTFNRFGHSVPAKFRNGMPKRRRVIDCESGPRPQEELGSQRCPFADSRVRSWSSHRQLIVISGVITYSKSCFEASCIGVKHVAHVSQVEARERLSVNVRVDEITARWLLIAVSKCAVPLEWLGDFLRSQASTAAACEGRRTQMQHR